MIEYTIKEDNNEILACFTSDPYVCEINITGLTNEDEIQLTSFFCFRANKES